jgi:NADH-ubiquinone oxidoreductase chain 1
LSSIAECNRHPFDFAEGESELVSGFNLEYGSIFFSSIFIAEYGIVLFAAMISSLCFFSPLLLLFCPLLLTLCLMLRARLPRSRLD